MRLLFSVLTLGAAMAASGCATKPKPALAAACVTSQEAESDALFSTLRKADRDPKGHHLFVTARTTDARGDHVLDLTVWPLSGPQEPAPGKRMRIVLQACTMKALRLVAL